MGPKKATKKQEEEVEDTTTTTTNDDESADTTTTTTTTTTTPKGRGRPKKTATVTNDEIDTPDTNNKRKMTRGKKQKEEEEEDQDEEEEEGDEDGDEKSDAQKELDGTNFKEPVVNDNQLKIISWNVAGYNSCSKKGLKQYIEAEKPDIICLQETKIGEASVPKSSIPTGYQYYFNECKTKKGLHGTALLTRIPPLKVTKGIGIDKHDQEGRVITAEYDQFYLVNSYVPNSGVDRKTPLARLGYRTKEWDVDFFDYMRNLNKTKPVIWCGDLNVAHTEIDLKNPKTNTRTAGFTIEERNSFGSFLNSGFIDTFRHFNPKKELAYSFWSYMGQARAKNTGWRLDYFVVSATFISSIASSWMRTNVMGSDHCPIGIIVNKSQDQQQ